jgi:hypothetical protein
MLYSICTFIVPCSSCTIIFSQQRVGKWLLYACMLNHAGAAAELTKHQGTINVRDEVETGLADFYSFETGQLFSF